jgi:hypothetical protein
MVERAAETDGLMNADEAAVRARLEARRFGRMAACALLTQERAEKTWTDTRLLEATREAVGGEPYYAMLREMMRGSG